MSIQINAPTSATGGPLADIQVHSAKMLSAVNAARRSFELPQGMAEQLRLPTITVPQGLAESIWSAKSLADSIARRNQQMLEIPNRYQDTVQKTQAIARRVAAVTAPILAEHRRFERAMAELAEPIRSAVVATNLSLSLPAVGFGGGRLMPNAPIVRVASKAARIVESALQRLRDRRHRDSDVRHGVELLVNLPNGEFLQVGKMSATEDGLIRVVGSDMDGLFRERFIAPEVIQYEIVTMKLPPPGAKLTLVE